jgi:hypothetical protein
MRFTEVPEDVIINTFAFGTATPGAPSEADLTSITNSIIDFYAGATSPGPTLASFMTNFLTNLAKHEVRLYDLALPPGAPPVRTTQFALAVTSGQQLPAEVSLCLSFKAAPQAGVAAGRLRGRIYLGPLSTAVLGVSQNSDIRPATGVQNALADAGLRLAGAAGHDLSVYSRTLGVLNPVTELWVDNAFDTQRRRGSKPTSRVTRLLGV